MQFYTYTHIQYIYIYIYIGVPIIVSNVYLRKTFHNDISPHFKFLLSNERLDFCEFFKIKDQKALNYTINLIIYIYII